MPLHHVNNRLLWPRAGCDDSARYVRCLRTASWVAMLLAIAGGFVDSSALHAGCRYSGSGHASMHRGAGDATALQFESGHAKRNAPALHSRGKWVYEAGEFRFLPWQSSKPCRGPDCGANDENDAPWTDASPQRSLRLPQLSLDSGIEHWHDPFAPIGVIDLFDACALAGFPLEREYPP